MRIGRQSGGVVVRAESGPARSRPGMPVLAAGPLTVASGHTPPREGPAVPDTTPRTVPELLLDRVARTPDEEAFRYPMADRWESLTWQQTLERIRAVAAGLLAKGVEPEQRCAILSSTRMEWVLADYGILCAGGATTTIYPSSMPDE